MSQLELFYWSQRWISNNLPPLPLVKFESPSYHPYEIDPSHYTDWDNSNDTQYDTYHDYYFQHSYNTHEYLYSESESDLDSDSEY